MAFYFDTFAEHCDYEANARYDYLSEAYGATARDCNLMAEEIELEEIALEKYEAEMTAAFGPCVRARDDGFPF